MSELLSCPFCDEKPNTTDYGRVGGVVWCGNTSCPKYPYETGVMKSLDNAIKSWNANAVAIREGSAHVVNDGKNWRVIKMPTSEERREVVRNLREPFDVVGQGRYVALNGTLFGMQLLANDEQTLRNGVKHLAYLIEPEPTVDRDALLALARDLEVSIMESGACGDVVGLVLNIVKQIRETCGEVNNHEA